MELVIGNGKITEVEESAERLAEIEAEQAKIPMKQWVQDMSDFDKQGMPRSREEILDHEITYHGLVLSGNEKTLYENKKQRRGQKP